MLFLTRTQLGVVITHVRGLITPLITTHEPPSKPQEFPCRVLARQGAELENGKPFHEPLSTGLGFRV